MKEGVQIHEAGRAGAGACARMDGLMELLVPCILHVCLCGYRGTDAWKRERRRPSCDPVTAGHFAGDKQLMHASGTYHASGIFWEYLSANECASELLIRPSTTSIRPSIYLLELDGPSLPLDDDDDPTTNCTHVFTPTTAPHCTIQLAHRRRPPCYVFSGE